MNTSLTSSTAAVLLGLALIGGASTEAQAQRYRPNGSHGHSTADGNIVDVQVQVDGRTAPLFFRPGQFDRHYFQAFKGRNYSVVLRNNTGRRIGVLLAVDGLNVVNGEKARIDRSESMYVLDPHERAVIQGWRTSLDDIRRFVFVDEERSYAERTGQANGDMGWIRVIAYREVEPRWGRNDGPRVKEGNELPFDARQERARGESSDDMAARPESRMAPESNPGTGWGDRRYDPVQQTWFEAERRPTDHLVLRYEYANGLRALGIFPRQNRIWDREEGNLGFAQPPRW
jgi:hypothetical protein